MILGPKFLLGFLSIGTAYIIGKKRLKHEDDKLAKFRSNYYKLLLVYGSIFVVFLISVLLGWL